MTASPAAMGAGAGLAWFVLFLLVDAAAQRLRGGGAPLLLLSYGACGVGFVASIILLLPAAAGLIGTTLALAFGGLANACLFVLYVPFVYVIRTSVSVQTMILLRRHGGRLPEVELYRRFGGRAILAERFATLVRSGYLVAEGRRFGLTPRGRAIARIFATVKALWRLGPGG